MTRRRKKPMPQPRAPWYKRHLEKLLAGVLGLLGLSGTGVAVSRGETMGEKQARTTTQVEQLQTDTKATKEHLDKHDRVIHSMDKKIDRVQLLQEIQLQKMGIPTTKLPPREYGPEEE